MRLVLDRRYKCDKYTIGHLYLDKRGQMVYLCDTLEDKDRGLSSDMPLSRILSVKVYGETAIPTGTYKITLKIISPKFKNRVWAKPVGGKLPRLLNVPGFDGILIHVGNRANPDSFGCILVGMNTVKGMVTKSTECFNKIYKIMKAADDIGEEITISIK